jgi:hypothetical protein
MSDIPPIELIVQPHCENSQFYFASWDDGEASRLLPGIPETMLDLAPYMMARLLLEQGYNPARLLIVRLAGADYELMRAPLGIVAAKPRLSTTPVEQPTRAFRAEQVTS